MSAIQLDYLICLLVNLIEFVCTCIWGLLRLYFVLRFFFAMCPLSRVAEFLVTFGSFLLNFTEKIYVTIFF